MTDIEQIVADAVSLAKRFQHEYVTIEHISAVALENSNIKSMCYEIQADALGLQEALLEYLNEDCQELIIDSDTEVTPKKTQMLERVFNRALTQALFQGKRGINQFDLLLSILGEDNSVTVHFAEEFGLSKDGLIRWMHDVTADPSLPPSQSSTTANAQPRTTAKKMSYKEATDVLAQFCTNMNEESSTYDDVIGRREELRDLVQTLARKKKSKS